MNLIPCLAAPPEVLLFQHLPRPAIGSHHFVGVNKMVAQPAKSPKTPDFGQFAKNPTLYKPRGALLIDCPLSCPWWNIERVTAAAKRAKACAVPKKPIPSLSPSPAFRRAGFGCLLSPSNRRDGFRDNLIFEFSESPRKVAAHCRDVSRDGCCGPLVCPHNKTSLELSRRVSTPRDGL